MVTIASVKEIIKLEKLKALYSSTHHSAKLCNEFVNFSIFSSTYRAIHISSRRVKQLDFVSHSHSRE